MAMDDGVTSHDLLREAREAFGLAEERSIGSLSRRSAASSKRSAIDDLLGPLSSIPISVDISLDEDHHSSYRGDPDLDDLYSHDFSDDRSDDGGDEHENDDQIFVARTPVPKRRNVSVAPPPVPADRMQMAFPNSLPPAPSTGDEALQSSSFPPAPQRSARPSQPTPVPASRATRAVARRQQRGVPRFAVFIGALAILAIISNFFGSPDDSSTRVENLSVGDCYAQPASSFYNRATEQNCAGSHGVQIYARIPAAQRAGLPGADGDEIGAINLACFDRYGLVIRDAPASFLLPEDAGISWLETTPSSSTDSDVLCVLESPSGALSGSIRLES